jgi:hypothetical protein
MSTDSSETDFERDVKQIVREYVHEWATPMAERTAESIRDIVIEQLKEELPKVLKAQETKTISENSRGPIETAPMVMIPEGLDPILVEQFAYAAAQDGKWVALVYNTMVEVPRISDWLKSGSDVRSATHTHGQQSITLKNGGRILWLAKDLKGGRGVSVNLVLRVEGRGEGMALNMANEERLFARQSISIRDQILDILKPDGTMSVGVVQIRLKEKFNVAMHEADIANILAGLSAQRLVTIHPHHGSTLVTYSRKLPENTREEVSDQNWHNILHVLPTGAKEAITTSHVIKKVHALGGVIYPNNVYIDALHRMASEGKINRRFSGQWLYYRDA